MIPTEYLRQVPIKHWLPEISYIGWGDVHIIADGKICREVITGYKVQRAFIAGTRPLLSEEAKLLMRGEEVEGFEWIDLPIVEGV